MAYQVNQETETRAIAQMRAELVRAAEVINRFGFNVVAFSQAPVSALYQISAEILDRQCEDLKRYTDTILKCSASGANPVESCKLLWFALKELRLTPPPDAFARISKNKVIEIYNESNQQIFRNLQFFNFCSYALEDLFLRPWTELFHRPDEGVMRQIFIEAAQVFTDPSRKIRDVAIPYHEVHEISSERRFCSRLKLDCLVPLVSSGKVAALIAIEEVEWLKSLEANVELSSDRPQRFTLQNEGL